jgi:hypothetical protein
MVFGITTRYYTKKEFFDDLKGRLLRIPWQENKLIIDKGFKQSKVLFQVEFDFLEMR